MAIAQKALGDLIGQLYLAAEDQSHWAGFLTSYSEAMQARDTNLVIVDWRRIATAVSVNVRSRPDLVAEYHARWSGEGNPYIQSRHPLMVRGGSVVSGREIVPDSRMRRTPYYNEFLRPAGLDDLVGINILANPRQMASVVTHYGPRDGERTSQQLGLARLLLPHLQCSVEMHLRLSESSMERAAFSQTVEKLAFGFVLVDGRGNVRRMNSAAERIIAAVDGLGFRDGRLRAEDPSADKILEAQIRACCNTTSGAGISPGSLVSVQRPSGAPGYVVRVSPVSKAGTLRESHGAGAVILIDDPTARPRIRLETLQVLFGLTRAESRVALTLLQDKTREEVAAELGVTINTVRTHAKTVFDKTGVSSRSALVRLLMTVAFGTN